MEKVYCKHCKYCVRLNTYAERYGCSHPQNSTYYINCYECRIEPSPIEIYNPDNACILYKEKFWRRLFKKLKRNKND